MLLGCMRLLAHAHPEQAYYLHMGCVLARLCCDDSVSASIDADRRFGLCRHHSATHVLHEALRRVLGEHVAQKGSLVAPQRLRFDFRHHTSLSDSQWHAVGEQANHIVLANDAVSTRVMPYRDALGLGARALFGERYGDKVRVVFIGRMPIQRRILSNSVAGLMWHVVVILV